MSTLAAILLSFLLSVGALVANIAPDARPAPTAKDIGPVISQTAQDNTPVENAASSENENPNDNFGSTVSSQTPTAPQEDGATFGANVATSAKDNGQNQDLETSVPPEPLETTVLKCMIVNPEICPPHQ